VEQGVLVTSIEVWEELRRGGDDLYDWVNARKAKMCIDYDATTQQAMLSILSKYPKLISDKAAGAFGADPHVIAVAQVYKYTVVANEVKRGLQAKKLGIPDVCGEIYIPCIKFLEFLRDQGWKYS
jgi:hypothetical protein